MTKENGKPRALKMSAWDLVDDAKTRVETLSIEDVKREMEGGDLVLVDIRDVRERWLRGTIPGAHSVPRGMLEFWADPSSEYYKEFLTPDARVILFCAGGGRSALSADVLQRMGYDRVAHMEAGFNGWKDAQQEWVPVIPPEPASA